MTVTRYVAVLPSIPGSNTLHTSRAGAEREIKLASRLGHDVTLARVQEVLVARRTA